MMFAMDLLSTLSSEQAQPVFNLRPVFSPTTRAEDVTQGEHGIDIRLCPVHASAFETGLNDKLVAAFHDAAADGPTLGLEEGILDLLFSFFEVSQVGGKGFRVGVLLLQLFQFG